MNERDFVTKKRADWERLDGLVRKASGRGGIRSLTREELEAIGPLYRRTASDLAAARTRAAGSDLVTHLNALVGRTYALLYEAPPAKIPPGRAVLNFYLFEFPGLLQKYARYFLAAFTLTILGGCFAYYLVITRPEAISLFVPPEFQSSLEAWRSGKVAGEADATQAASLMTHNFFIGILSAVTGFLGGVCTVWLLFNNGAMLGAFSAVMTQYGTHKSFWPGILPHGIAELSAIFICGAAGLLFGKAVLVPGKYGRLDALRVYGTDAIKLVLGTIPMFIFAGVIEGMFSHLSLAAGFRYAFAALNGLLWYLYLFLPRPAAVAQAALASKTGIL